VGASAWYSDIVSSVENSWWLVSPVSRYEAGLLGRLTADAVIEPIEQHDRVRASSVWKSGPVRGLWKDGRGRTKEQRTGAEASSMQRLPWPGLWCVRARVGWGIRQVKR
jgi:hypothetical protein